MSSIDFLLAAVLCSIGATPVFTHIDHSRTHGPILIKTIVGDIAMTGLIDTGAANVIVPQDIIDTLVERGLAKNTDRTINIVNADNHISPAHIYSVSSITVGKRTVQDFEVLSTKQTVYHRVIIGMELLTTLGVRIYPDQRMVVFPAYK